MNNYHEIPYNSLKKIKLSFSMDRIKEEQLIHIETWEGYKGYLAVALYSPKKDVFKVTLRSNIGRYDQQLKISGEIDSCSLHSSTDEEEYDYVLHLKGKLLFEKKDSGTPDPIETVVSLVTVQDGVVLEKGRSFDVKCELSADGVETKTPIILAPNKICFNEIV